MSSLGVTFRFSDPVALRRELYGLVSDEPDVRWLACGNEAGGMTDAGRVADGTIVFLMTDDFRAGVYRQYEASGRGYPGRWALRDRGDRGALRRSGFPLNGGRSGTGR
jgi:hypothetical protein